MKGPFRCVFVLFFLLLPGGILSAQSKNEAKIPVKLAVLPKASFSLAGSDLRISAIQGKGAEQIISPSTVGKIWINYSSVVDGNTTNSICVSLGSGNLPAEVVVKLNVGPDAGAGFGKVGKPVGQITLSSFPQAIITDIGSCYTDQGINKGHPLTYSWELSPEYDQDILSIENLNIEVGVIYTITTNE
jgi:hypothetical protein